MCLDKIFKIIQNYLFSNLENILLSGLTNKEYWTNVLIAENLHVCIVANFPYFCFSLKIFSHLSICAFFKLKTGIS